MAKKYTGRFLEREDEHVLEIPSAVAEEGLFKRGDELHVSLEDGRLTIRKAMPGERSNSRLL